MRILPSPPAEAGTRFSNPGGMQGWVDLCYVKATGRELNPRPVLPCYSNSSIETLNWTHSTNQQQLKKISTATGLSFSYPLPDSWRQAVKPVAAFCKLIVITIQPFLYHHKVLTSADVVRHVHCTSFRGRRVITKACLGCTLWCMSIHHVCLIGRQWRHRQHPAAATRG